MPPRTILITALALAACTPSRRRTADDTLVIAIETAMTTSDPRYAITNYDEKLGKLVAPGLTTVETPNAEARLQLAASVTNVDPVTIDIALRPDARFSDGNPVTGDDVARTYTSVLDAKCESVFHTEFLERFVLVEATGERTVRFHLKQPLGTFVTDITFGIISFHGVPPGECHPAQIRGAGPYVLSDLTSFRAQLDANPYALEPPRTPHVEIRFVSDPSARLIMLVGGSVDVLQNSARPDLVDDILQRPRVKASAAPSVLLTYLMLNNDNEMLRDVRVREAIALALDRPTIISAKLGGRAVLATGLLPPTHWAYSREVETWQRDLPRAEHLLDDAGFPRRRGGVRMHLLYKTSADPFRVTVARLIASQLADVGIDVEVRAFEFATFFADIKVGNYELASMQTAPITEPDFHYFYFHSSRIPSPEAPNAGNRWRYRNPEVDRLTEAGRHETDPARRRAIYGDVQRLIAHDLPIIPLWHEDNVVLSHVDVDGYVISPNAGLFGLATARKSH